MNDRYGCTANAAGKKEILSSAARALVLGLALLLPGAAALASNKPIPGIDIVVKCLECKPPFHGIPVPTGADGMYQFKGLAPGNYDLFVGGQRVQTINVGANRSISGVLSSDGGKASITVNGQVGVVPDEPAGAPVNTSRSNKKTGIAVGDVNGDGRAEMRTAQPDRASSITMHGQVGVVPVESAGALLGTSRSNKKAGIAKGEEPPPDNVLPSAPVNTSRSHLQHGEHGPSKVAENESPRPTNRGTAPPPNNGAGQEQSTVRKAGGRPPEEYGTASPPKTEGDKLPGLAGEPIKGGVPPPIVVPGTLAIAKDGELPGKTGHAPKPVSTGTGLHRSLKAGEPTPDGPASEAKEAHSALGQVATTRGTAPRPEGGDTAPGIFDRWGNRAPHPSADINGDVKPATIVSSGAQLQLAPGITVNPVNDAPSKAAEPIPAGFGQQVTFTATIAPINPANNPPGVAGDPVPGTSVGLDHDPGGPISTTKTDANGAYQFTGLPAGKYKLTFPGLPAKSITIGTDGQTGGKVLRDGNNVIVTGDFAGSPARSQANANPVPGFLRGVFPGIGIGNVMGGILPGMGPSAVGPGAGPMSPAASPMSPGGPMGPGAGAIRR